MMNVLFGALGMLLVLALLALGFLLGWKMNTVWRSHAKKVVADEVSEQELMRLKAEQRAFEGMLNYNTEMAYGLVPDLAEVARGDE